MEITVDIESTTPMFTQLVMQIKQAVQSGQLVPGDPLPSIRQLANVLEINNKTVAKAYRLLERDAIIQPKGYRGTFVHPDAKDNCSVDLNAWVRKELTQTITAFKTAGVTDSEIRIVFADVLNQLTGV